MQQQLHTFPVWALSTRWIDCWDGRIGFIAYKYLDASMRIGVFGCWLRKKISAKYNTTGLQK